MLEKELRPALSAVSLDKALQLLSASGWRAELRQHEKFWVYPAAWGTHLSSAQERSRLFYTCCPYTAASTGKVAERDEPLTGWS